MSLIPEGKRWWWGATVRMWSTVRILADRDPGPGGDPDVVADPGLGMECGAAVAAVRHLAAFDMVGNDPHHPMRQLGRLVVAPVALVAEQSVDQFGEAEDAEHGGEPLRAEQGLTHEEGVLVEPGFLDEIPHPRLDHLEGGADVGGESLVEVPLDRPGVVLATHLEVQARGCVRRRREAVCCSN